ncbi:MAG: hypothetical protein KKG59_05100 [Nanoarchaeota archaeon]|nr:hypothetical protein [Nanoarchaeota archaeon]
MNTDWEDHIEFITASYFKGKDYILNNKKFFEWQFRNPFSDKHCFTLVRLDERIVAELGYIPTQLKLFDKTVLNINLVNMMALEKYRGKGIGFMMVRDSEKYADICTNTGFGPLTPITRLKWTQLSDMNRYLFVCNAKKVSELAQEPVDETKLASVSELPDSSLISREADDFAGADKLWAEVKEKYPITIERSEKYLNWRYAYHPLLKYHIITMGAETMDYDKQEGMKAMKSFCVVRFEEPEGYKIARILDFISFDDAEEFALNEAVKYCKKEGADLIDFFFTGDFHKEALEKTGFVSAEKYKNLPMLFNPIDRGRTSINFAFKLTNLDYYAEKMNKDKNWYVTKGDGDQDRPN